jgi:uncharacterized membrane protein YphA (DoxX/SURF4 family)
MTVALWIVNIVLALAFLASGLTKVSQSKSKLQKNMPWVVDFPAGAVKLIGTAEVIGALGLVLPVITGITPVLAPIAAICLAVIMAGAILVHVRRTENFVPALVLGIVAIVSAVLGFAAL